MLLEVEGSGWGCRVLEGCLRRSILLRAFL